MEKAVKYLKVVVIGALAVYLSFKLYKPAIKVSMPFALSLLLAYLLNPIVITIESGKISRRLSIAIVYAFLTSLLLIGGRFIAPSICGNLTELAVRLPGVLEKYELILNELIIRYEVSNLPESIKLAIDNNIQSLGALIEDLIYDSIGIISDLFSNFIYILLVPFITYYLLKDGQYFKEKLAVIIPVKYRDEAAVTWYQMDMILKKFIKGQLLVSLIVGLLTVAVLYLLNVRYPIALGFIAGVMDLIPYFGPLLGAVPIIIIAISENIFLLIKVIIALLTIQTIESAVISPKIVGESVGMHPITVIFIILLFEQLFGIIGMFFAVPAASVIFVVFNRVISKLTKYYH